MLAMSRLATALVAMLWLWSVADAHADDWPSRPVKIVVAFAPGGSADQFGRLMAAELATAFKQQFFVENRPGNSGTIGSAQVARAEADGYTLLIGGSGPHLPTFAEQGYPDVRGDTWFWLCGPWGLPADVVGKLSGATRRIVQSPKVQEHFRKLALLSKDLDVAGVQEFIAAEYAFWAPLARNAGLKVQ